MELSAADYLQRAREHKRQLRYADAVQACDAALALDPTLATAYLLRAETRFFSHGNPYASVLPNLSVAEQAIIAADVEQAVHFAANDITLLMECAEWMVMLRGVGKVARAIEIYSHVITIDPTFCRVYLQRGWVYQIEGRHTEAIADFTEAIRIDPTRPDGYAARGNVYEAMRQRPQAAADFRQALELGHTGYKTQWMKDYVWRYSK